MKHLEQPRPTLMEILGKESSDTGFKLNCRVPENLLYFEGHFTGSPVVAGVVQLMWVKEALTQHLGRPFLLGNMEAVKFHQLLFPGQAFEMTLSQKRDKWLYHIQSGEHKIASGRMLEVSN